jgi:integrase
VIAIYSEEVASRHARPKEALARLGRVLDLLGDKRLSQLTGAVCRGYATKRGNLGAARRELEDLRAAVRYYHAEGYVTEAPRITLPDRGEARERWLTRSEAARLLWAAWCMRQNWKGQTTDRRTGQHLARFILVALYTGTRAGAVCGAAIRPTVGRGFVDTERGVFHRRPPGSRETKKRQPPIRLPDRLLAHLRRWERLGLSGSSVVEWQGRPVQRINKAFRAARTLAGLGDDVVPHTLRHTAATWLMQAGCDAWEASGYLGMTLATLERTYGHHHESQFEGARAAITGRQKGHSQPNNQPSKKEAV